MIRKINEEDIKKLFPARPGDCHKGSFGYVAMIGGSLEYSGAIRLAAMANSAMRAGAGVASIAAPRSICDVIAGHILEATIFPLSDVNGKIRFSEDEFAEICTRYDAIAFGMGIGHTEETVKAVEYLLKKYEKTLIVDADGLNAMSELDRDIICSSKARLVLTPHVKEFARLSGLAVDEIKAKPDEAAAALADELNAVVLLKGSTTYVAAPSDGEEQQILCTDRGCPGMATAGSGDVLSGILAAICVNADNLCTAAAAGAYINGLAGEIAQKKRSDVTMTASDTALCIAEAVESVGDGF